MVPWTPWNQTESPPIALSEQHWEGGSPTAVPRYPQMVPVLPRFTSSSSSSSSTEAAEQGLACSTLGNSENFGNRFWAIEITLDIETLADDMEPNTLPGFLSSSAFVWKINCGVQAAKGFLLFGESTFPCLPKRKCWSSGQKTLCLRNPAQTFQTREVRKRQQCSPSLHKHRVCQERYIQCVNKC